MTIITRTTVTLATGLLFLSAMAGSGGSLALAAEAVDSGTKVYWVTGDTTDYYALVSEGVKFKLDCDGWTEAEMAAAIGIPVVHVPFTDERVSMRGPNAPAPDVLRCSRGTEDDPPFGKLSQVVVQDPGTSEIVEQHLVIDLADLPGMPPVYYLRVGCVGLLELLGHRRCEIDNEQTIPINWWQWYTRDYTTDIGCHNGEEARPCICGDGVRDDGRLEDPEDVPLEFCDDGADSFDGYWTDEEALGRRHCNGGCSGWAPFCGDGAIDVEYGEICDNGDHTVDEYERKPEHLNNGGCDQACQRQGYCGNGHLELDVEDCDDGNNVDLGDYCSNDCRVTGKCGDDALQNSLEFCDQGEENSDAWAPTRHCRGDCQDWAPCCGDGATAPEETCDSGEGNNNDAWALTKHCKEDCMSWAPYCGDSNPDSGHEVCDEGSSNSNSWSPDPHCKERCDGIAPYCGDGIENGPERCDDGDHNGDGWHLAERCSTSCEPSPYCGDGDEFPGLEHCDEGLENSDAYPTDHSSTPSCSTNCQEFGPYCGDGRRQTEYEKCDLGTGNNVGGYGGCNSKCKRTGFCGDGTCDPEEQSGQQQCSRDCLGETCDDGNPCTIEDRWQSNNQCYGRPKNCSDGDQCTVDHCDGSNGQCKHSAAPVGTSCSDGSLCTYGEACQSDGTCGGGTYYSCSDGNECTYDTCLGGGSCDSSNKPNGTRCGRRGLGVCWSGWCDDEPYCGPHAC